jgi:AhpD family alkylhydroperoxidase
MEARLSQKEKELVAVGVSVAAGCIPCARYHMEEVRAAGATTDEITHAVEAALCVKRSASGVMEKAAYDALGSAKEEQPARCIGTTDRMKELVSVAAAVAVNCPTNFHKHVAAGRSVGVLDDEIQLVVGLAKMIRSKAAEKVDEAAREVTTPKSTVAQACCGSPVERTREPEAAAAGCCGISTADQPNQQTAHAASKGPCC